MTAPDWPSGLAAMTLFTEDLEATKAFYRRVFNLPIHHQDEVSAVFKLGDTLLNLLQISQADELISPAKVAGPEAGSRFVFTLLVDDVDAKCAELKAKGVTFLNGPMDRPWGIRTASSQDPAGYIWELAKWN